MDERYLVRKLKGMDEEAKALFIKDIADKERLDRARAEMLEAWRKANQAQWNDCIERLKENKN